MKKSAGQGPLVASIRPTQAQTAECPQRARWSLTHCLPMPLNFLSCTVLHWVRSGLLDSCVGPNI